MKRKEGALSLTRDPTDLLLCKLQALLPIPRLRVHLEGTPRVNGLHLGQGQRGGGVATHHDGAIGAAGCKIGT